MHVHSNHSKDSKSKVKDIINFALKKGLNAISITDHNTVDGSLEAMDVVKEENLNITVIPGIEISTSDGHLLAYGVKRDIDCGMSMIDTIRLVKNLGGITAVAHPFQFYRHGLVKFWIAKEADAIEIFNSKYILGLCNFLSNKLAKFYKKPGIAGSDAHKVEEVGAAVTLIKCNKNDILKAIVEGRTTVKGRRQKLRNWKGFKNPR